jgi:hypothetical protein
MSDRWSAIGWSVLAIGLVTAGALLDESAGVVLSMLGALPIVGWAVLARAPSPVRVEPPIRVRSIIVVEPRRPRFELPVLPTIHEQPTERYARV